MPVGAMLEFSTRGNEVTSPRTLDAWVRIEEPPGLVKGIRTSLQLAGLTWVAMLALPLPTMVWVRLRLPQISRIVEFICLLPLTVPAIALVVGLKPLYIWININVTPSVLALAFAYLVLVLPYSYRSLDAGLAAIDVKTLSEAARSLRAGWATVMLRIIIPNIPSALGPPGSGRTTALRLAAGLEEATAGRVVFGGKDVPGLPASKRDVGMVFQAYSLFPHMPAMENVAFGPTLRHKPADERRRRSGEMLDLVGLSSFADRYAHQLSGGQQQRVALARPPAIEPTVLLLDEPLSALDAKVRARLRDEIRRVQLEVGTTTLFVTHDQEEALAIADRVGVMRSGHLEQLGPPTTIYSRPATPFVAEFVGLTNRLTDW